MEYLYERQYHPNVGSAVLGTSYAMLCTLARNHVKQALPIMKFIAAQHNHLMGWSSTHVSVAVVVVVVTVVVVAVVVVAVFDVVTVVVVFVVVIVS